MRSSYTLRVLTSAVIVSAGWMVGCFDPSLDGFDRRFDVGADQRVEDGHIDQGVADAGDPISGQWTEVVSGLAQRDDGSLLPGSHTCGINNGSLYCWGANGNGQLGIGRVSRAEVSPRQVPMPNEAGRNAIWLSVSAGTRHTCGIVGSGTRGHLYCWGFARAFLPGEARESEPLPVRMGEDRDWTIVAAGGEHTCAIRGEVDAGTLSCWGSDRKCQVGGAFCGGRDAAVAFSHARSFSNDGTLWRRVSVGPTATCAIQIDGSLWCWGADDVGQVRPHCLESTCSCQDDHCPLGQPWPSDANDNPNVLLDPDDSYAPNEERMAPRQWSDVSVGSSQICASSIECATGLTNCEHWCWGNTMSDPERAERHLPLVRREKGRAIATGYDHTCVWDPIFCWGGNAYGQLGQGVFGGGRYLSDWDGYTPGWSQVATGQGMTCGINSQNLSCFGNNSEGQLGTGAASSVRTPTKLDSDAWWSITMDDGDYRHGSVSTCGIKKQDAHHEFGALYCWGANGSSWAGTEIAREQPKFSSLQTMSVQQVARSAHTICAVSAGQVICEGNCGGCQDGCSIQECEGWQPEGEGWRAISVPDVHVCGIMTEGMRDVIKCIGNNSSGVFGVCDVPFSAQPREVIFPVERVSATWKSIEFAGARMLALDGSGSLWSWNTHSCTRNDDGPPYDPTPCPVANHRTWHEFHAASGSNFGVACGITTDGHIVTMDWTCFNTESTCGRESPCPHGFDCCEATIPPPADCKWKAVSCGGYHVCAICGDPESDTMAGRLYCWSEDADHENHFGELGFQEIGYGSPTEQPVLRPDGSPDLWVKVSTAIDSTCAISSDGSLWCFGRNNLGQLGLDPAMTDQVSPVPVRVSPQHR